MKDIIKVWKGYRLEFEQEYGSDMDGACEYSSFSTFDWSIDIAEIIETNMMGWVNGKVGVNEYSKIYLEEATAEKLKVHFTCGYAIELSWEKKEYSYNYCFGRGNYTDRIRIVASWEKKDELAEYEGEEIHCRRKCLVKLKPKDVLVPKEIVPVDLGLSVNWAPFNLGAESPEGFGDRFAWSSVVPEKEGYGYIRGLNDDEGKTMFDSRGNCLYEFSGMKKYDAATAFWGNGWRTPTREEIQELVYECKWTPKKLEGREGYEVKGASGNTIFLPLDKEEKNWEGRYGMTFWSSSGYMMPGGSTKGYTLELWNHVKGEDDDCSVDDWDTATPLNIRPVKDRE